MTNEELINILRMALPYVEGAYECAFPDERENGYVADEIRDAIEYLSELNKSL